MRRYEKRRIDRRRARRKSRKIGGSTWCDIYSGDLKRITLQLRSGGIRHQPRRVRENVNGKRHYMSRAENEQVNKLVEKVAEGILYKALMSVFGVGEENKSDTKTAFYPDEIPDDPLPSHEPDGYWSGYKSRWPFDKDPDTEYAEGRKAISDMAIRYRQDYPFTFRTSRTITVESAEDFRKYIERVYTVDLIIPNGDNRIRYQLLRMDKDTRSAVGMLCCRCGDCGKIAAGILHGNPDMGDWAYQYMHRKDWFCCNFGWTFMGGHGHPQGRRMICPECSKKYEEGEND